MVEKALTHKLATRYSLYSEIDIDVDMIISIRFENEVDGAGSIMMYKRKSMTCRAKIGQLDFKNEEEKNFLKTLLTTSQPSVEVIPMNVRIGNFVDVYMKK